MADTVKIIRLEIENVKRIKAVKIELTANGLTVIGGKNNQGKTTTLDCILWALGGKKYEPSQAQRDGSVLPPSIRIVLSNGLIVERKGKNSDLKVTDPTGKKGGQQLLDEFVEELALNLPKFMQSSDKEKGDTLLRIIGVGDKLYQLEDQEKQLYNRRLTIGQIKDQKEKYAKEQISYPEAPKELVSASDLIKQQQDILARNGENQRKRQNLQLLEQKEKDASALVARLQLQLEEATEKLTAASADVVTARKSALDLHDESTAELEQSINSIEEINRKVRANLDKEKAEEDAKVYADLYTALTTQIEDVRQSKTDLLKGAALPLEGLLVVDGELTYNGYKWDSMSGSDQLKVSTAIVRKLNPKCGFVLLDKLEQMDLDTLNEFGAWLEAEGLQAIATRVSTGGECSIIIEDGYVAGADNVPETPVEAPAEETPKWKEGEF